MKLAAISASALLLLTACQHVDQFRVTKASTPVPAATIKLMARQGMNVSAPILFRSFKKESELEVWKLAGSGRYELLKVVPMCRWSGQLGPKIREGDRQAPEGFYRVTPAAMNPNSSLFLSFDLGFPNDFDRTHNRTGSHLMVHGSCTSSGCFAITDEAMAEVYALARDAFGGGQPHIQFQSYPFRMTPENLARHRADPNINFWRDLKAGSDLFEVTGREPRWVVKDARYSFDDDLKLGENALLAQRRVEHEKKVAELVGAGAPAIRFVYSDGGSHASFRSIVDTGLPRGETGSISRPESLLLSPREERITLPSLNPISKHKRLHD